MARRSDVMIGERIDNIPGRLAGRIQGKTGAKTTVALTGRTEFFLIICAHSPRLNNGKSAEPNCKEV